ncbi:reducing type I polyketide synthase [Trichoderma camerunense]
MNSSMNTDHAIRETAVPGTEQPPQPRQTAVAIVGMACRLPGHCSSIPALWSFLEQGKIAKTQGLQNRFNLVGHYDGSRKPYTMGSPGGMFLEYVDPAVFDAQFFNLSRTESNVMDPQHRQVLEVTYECLENAGIPLEKIRGSNTGCFIASGHSDWDCMMRMDGEGLPTSFTIGTSTAYLSNRVSHFLDIHGPSITMDTACSGSLVALDVACWYLHNRQADAMIVGGSSIWMRPEDIKDVGPMHSARSVTGKCHTFDSKADGYVKSEGINIVYVKRLEDAIRDNDPIRAVIVGTAGNSAGRSPNGIFSPSAELQAINLRTAYANAGITNFNDTTYLECHGTGTSVGDAVEANGVASVFAKTRDLSNPLIIGSIKSNLGHSEAAAGLSGLFKAVLAMENRTIPGNPTFITPSPKINFEELRIRATRRTIKWPQAKMLRASVNSFGFGGSNAHAVIQMTDTTTHKFTVKQRMDEEGQIEGTDSSSHRPVVLAFSANDQDSLKTSIEKLSTHFLDLRVRVSLGDLAYTLSERRSRHYYRAFIVTRSAQEFDENPIIFGKPNGKIPKVGFVFTGQGAQWPQMGRELIATFPSAERLLKHLDSVLQALPSPPKWSILAELKEERSSEHLRLPEFSQPLVTALQLAIHQVLLEWGVEAAGVIGHSSGEIAAAAAAGLLTPEEAIKVAFYRGQAAKVASASENDSALGMLAVGIGADQARKYIETHMNDVQISCYNSPHSVTLSGKIPALEAIRDDVKADNHFARLLQIDLAYHSKYMTEIGDIYHKMLVDSTKVNDTSSHKAAPIKMFSSVTGALLNEPVDAAYWRTNMVLPVQFMQAMTEMLGNGFEADFLIEIGPSGALSGPIKQIKDTFAENEQASQVQYLPTLKRAEADAITPLYEVAGTLFLRGGQVDLDAVNRDKSVVNDLPSVLVDLPNYAWNHSKRWWYESPESAAYRLAPFASHDLLGSKDTSSSWSAPRFRRELSLEQSPWLKDHTLSESIIFPAAGYIAMTVEAAFQTAYMTQWKQKIPARYQYKLKDLNFHRALVLKEEEDVRVYLNMTPCSKGDGLIWYKFEVNSYSEDAETEHSSGFICVESDYEDVVAPAGTLDPIHHDTSAMWYKAAKDCGTEYGPSFQTIKALDTPRDKRFCRGLLDMRPPASAYPQSLYPVHPVALDGALQSGHICINMGEVANLTTVMLVGSIKSMTIPFRANKPETSVIVASAEYTGIGREDIAKSYEPSFSLYDPETGDLILELERETVLEMEAPHNKLISHKYARLSWLPDITMLFQGTQSQFQKIYHVFLLMSHKNPQLQVLEMDLTEAAPDVNTATSFWLNYVKQLSGDELGMAEGTELHFTCTHSEIFSANQKESSNVNVEFSLLGGPEEQFPTLDGKRDLVVVHLASSFSKDSLESLLANVHGNLANDGFALLALDTSQDSEQFRSLVTKAGFFQLFEIAEHIAQLGSNGMNVEVCSNAMEDITSSQTVVVLELDSPVMDRLDAKQWRTLQHLVETKCNILWVTMGAYFNVTDPSKALISGLFRVLQTEEPLLHLITLDLASLKEKDVAALAAMNVSAIKDCLSLTSQPKPKERADMHFVQHDGVLYISRVILDSSLNEIRETAVASYPLVNRRLLSDGDDSSASSSSYQLRATRLGNMDALNWVEIQQQPPLQPGHIQVELQAWGLNFKDVLIAMGIVPGNEYALGFDSAGIVTKLGEGVESFQVGQRVAIMAPGQMVTRTQIRADQAHVIPDSMSFAQAAALPLTYMTAMHCLFDIAKIQTGQKVLIHSAAGGVGIAAVQLCKHMKAEIYATVGNEEKRAYLREQYGIPDERIFSSRHAGFGQQIMKLTNGSGVDVILNSLTGELLHESWRTIASNGTMVELGLRDILEKSSLSMDPFGRNASYRAVNLSNGSVSVENLKRLLSNLFHIIAQGQISLNSPIEVFSASEASTAFRRLNSGKVIGKVVISNESTASELTPVRPTPDVINLRENASYVLVGGLRGLTGSLAIYLARHGAKKICVFSRSQHTDDTTNKVIRDLKSLGCEAEMMHVDITKMEDVRSAFQRMTLPVAGIIQGAMVLNDRPFSTMTLDEYHATLAAKVQGTWNLHNIALEQEFPLDFFTLLSSISGVVGSGGQANYAAANTFLDAFAQYRRCLDLPACTIDLGVMSDVGIVARDQGVVRQRLSMYEAITERVFQQIVYFSTIQQQKQRQSKERGWRFEDSTAQMLTGMPVPPPESSPLEHDARFAALYVGNDSSRGASGASDGANEAQELKRIFKNGNAAARLHILIQALRNYIMKILRIEEELDVDRPLSGYGLDSLAAIEIRNWFRAGPLGLEIRTLELLNASSLRAFCSKVVSTTMDT